MRTEARKMCGTGNGFAWTEAGMGNEQGYAEEK